MKITAFLGDIFTSKPELIKARARLVLILLMVALLVHAVASTSIVSVPSSGFGLVSMLPITFWIGLALLAPFWYLSSGSEKYQILGLVFTLVYLFLAPSIIRVPVWISESFYPYGESLLIGEYGHLVTPAFAIEHIGVERSLPLTGYHFWPLFLYLASSFKLITGMPDSVILKFFPLLIISLYAFLTFLILKGKGSGSFAVFGAALLICSFFTRQNYFGPQGIALIFFLLIVWISSKLLFENPTRTGTLTALFVFSFTVITLTHALTSLVTLMVIFAVFLAQRLSHNNLWSGRAARLSIFSVLILLSYNFFIVPSFFDRSIQELSSLLFGLEDLGLYRETGRIVGSEAQQLNYWVSWAIVITVCLIAVLQVFLLFYRLRTHKRQGKQEFSFFAMFWLVMVFVFALTAVYGSHEAYQRAFMFGLIPLTFLCISLLLKKPRLLLLILGGLLFMNVVAQYGADSYRIATEPILEGTSFFVYNTPNNVSVLYGFYPHVRYFDPLKFVSFVSIPGTLPFTSYPNSSAVNGAVMRADYIIRSSLQHNYYVYFLAEDPLDRVDFDKLNRVYDNLDFKLFVHAD